MAPAAQAMMITRPRRIAPVLVIVNSSISEDPNRSANLPVTAYQRSYRAHRRGLVYLSCRLSLSLRKARPDSRCRVSDRAVGALPRAARRRPGQTHGIENPV